jgi:sigma-E factor negative regulatory protein RseC
VKERKSKMDQVGKIEKINGNSGTISVKRVSACGDNCKSCGASCTIKSVLVETEIPKGLNVGDYVEITTENEVMFKHILVLYGLPLVLMLGTIFVVHLLLSSENKDLISALSGLASLGVSFFLLKAYDKSEMKKNTLKFTVARKL